MKLKNFLKVLLVLFLLMLAGGCSKGETDNSDSLDEDVLEGDEDIEDSLVRYNESTNMIEYRDSWGKFRNINRSEIVPVLPEDRKIKIFKNDSLVREEEIDPTKISREGSKLKKFKTKDEAADFVNSSLILMKKFDIEKRLYYNPIENNTNVKIVLKNIPVSERKNLTLYQVIPKTVAEDISQIEILNGGGGQLFVVDKDPIIGWYFNESSNEEVVEYKVPGDNEGGDIIITQESILYNEGELVVSYRETDCNLGEVQLFELDDLIDSRVYPVGSGKFFKVCLAHLTENLEFEENFNNSLHFFNFSTSGNVSFENLNGFENIVGASVDRSDIHWDIRIQDTNPTGNYSCLGSIENTENSLFGDCGYTSNRIWVHLGEDLIAPTSNVTLGPLAHTVSVILSAQDNVGGVGLDKIEYCIDEENNCVPDIVVNDYEKAFAVSCPNDWGCIKFLRFRSYDLAGNIEDTNSYVIKILDKGSSCQADCSGKPSPNRYLKECNNLNSCNFYSSVRS